MRKGGAPQVLLAAWLIAGAVTGVALGADGDLDPAFGSGGRVTTDLGGDERGNALVRQTDGMLVAAGWADGDFLVVRYETSGAPDLGFGTGGATSVDVTGTDSFDEANDLAVAPSGAIVVVGAGADRDVSAVARLTAEGDLDPTFGPEHDGTLTTARSRPTSPTASTRRPRWRCRPTARS